MRKRSLELHEVPAQAVVELSALATTPLASVPRIQDRTLERLKDQAALQRESDGRGRPLYHVLSLDPGEPQKGLALLPPHPRLTSTSTSRVIRSLRADSSTCSGQPPSRVMSRSTATGGLMIPLTKSALSRASLTGSSNGVAWIPACTSITTLPTR